MQATIPLGLLAAEHNTTVDALARRLDGEVVIDDAGLRAVPISVARRLYEQRLAKQAGDRERREAHRASIAASLAPVHQRVAAIAERHKRLRAAGLLDDDMSAYAAMVSADKQAQLDGRPSRRMDALLRGESYGATFGGLPPRKD